MGPQSRTIAHLVRQMHCIGIAGPSALRQSLEGVCDGGDEGILLVSPLVGWAHTCDSLGRRVEPVEPL